MLHGWAPCQCLPFGVICICSQSLGQRCGSRSGALGLDSRSAAICSASARLTRPCGRVPIFQQTLQVGGQAAGLWQDAPGGSRSHDPQRLPILVVTEGDQPDGEVLHHVAAISTLRTADIVRRGHQQPEPSHIPQQQVLVLVIQLSKRVHRPCPERLLAVDGTVMSFDWSSLQAAQQARVDAVPEMINHALAVLADLLEEPNHACEFSLEAGSLTDTDVTQSVNALLPTFCRANGWSGCRAGASR